MCRFVELWMYGVTELCRYVTMKLRWYGVVELYSYEVVELRSYGVMSWRCYWFMDVLIVELWSCGVHIFITR